ncbi:MAG: hypothetical protein WC958_01725 [Dehalococcoidales bacterium]
MRTQDWACYLCGYPLVSPNFKLIEKTFGQIREERLYGAQPLIEDESPISSDCSEADNFTEMMDSVPQVFDIKDAYDDNDPDENPSGTKDDEDEDEVCEALDEDIDEAPITADITVADEETNESLQDLPEDSVDEEEIVICEEEAEQEEVFEEPPQTEPEPPTASPDIEITVSDLLSEYADDYTAATAKFINKTIRLSGYVVSIDIKEVLAVNYIRLSDDSLNLPKSVQCMFDKKYANKLKELEKGQYVTVQGNYTGSLIAMRLADCVLVEFD